MCQRRWQRSRRPAAVDFNREIRPLLSKNCFACHGPDEEQRQAGLRLDVRDAALGRAGERRHGHRAQARRAKSELCPPDHVRADADVRMPPDGSGRELSAEQIQRLHGLDRTRRRLRRALVVRQAAASRAAAPSRSPAGRATRSTTSCSPSWTRRSSCPSPEADPYQLIRRLSLDLRGLPPTLEEIEAFQQSAIRNPQSAIETLVDRLLADPAYGERWARLWLDLARYADSRGYGSDPLRPHIWRWRDWTIEAFNRNLPFDQFTHPAARRRSAAGRRRSQTRIATAFHRNTMTNTEGGTDDEEFRIAAVKDRLDTTLQVWMGLTMGCAKCHNHKYDPITQEQYYQAFALFNQTADADRPDESPTLEAPTPEMIELARRLDPQIAAAEAADRRGAAG